jgi:hypothetical protein
LPLYSIVRPACLRAKAKLLWQYGRQLAMMAVVGVLVFAPQLFIWHEATGRWIVNSYSHSRVSFNFAKPHIFNVLFSFKPHGLLPWAPVLVLAVVGLLPMWRSARGLIVPVIVITVLDVYLIASWEFWSYGGGYGHRGFVDILPLLAIPLTALYSWSWSHRRRLLVAVPAMACCLLATIQMLNYWQLKIPFDGASPSQYVRLLRSPL